MRIGRASVGGAPKALVITRNLPPLTGGMENLVWRLVESLLAAYETRVVGPKGSAASGPSGSWLIEVPHRPLVLFLVRALFAGIRSIIAWRPDVVVAGSGLTAPVAWLIGRCSRARVSVYIHGLDIEARSRTYQAIWIPFIRRADTVIANSEFTAGLALERGVGKAKLSIVHPGTTLPDMGDSETERSAFRNRYGLITSRIMLYVGRITKRKGLAVFCESVFPSVAAACPDVHLVVIGSDPSDAIARDVTNLRQSIEEILRKQGLSNRVSFLGRLDDQEVSQAYLAADVHIFPVEQNPGDSEGFGMVALEAAAHGTPTVAYAAGGVSDAVGHAKSGYLVTPGDAIGFSRRVIDVLEGASAELTPRAFAEAFNWERFSLEIREAVVRE